MAKAEIPPVSICGGDGEEGREVLVELTVGRVGGLMG